MATLLVVAKSNSVGVAIVLFALLTFTTMYLQQSVLTLGFLILTRLSSLCAQQMGNITECLTWNIPENAKCVCGKSCHGDVRCIPDNLVLMGPLQCMTHIDGQAVPTWSIIIQAY